MAGVYETVQPEQEAGKALRLSAPALSATREAGSGAGAALAGISSTQEAHIRDSYGRLPMSFEANEGQADPQVRFFAHGGGYTLFLTATDAVLSLQKPAAPMTADPTLTPAPAAAATELRMQVVGANPAAPVVGREQLPGKVNYFRGNDPSQWHTDVPTYGRVEYHDVYPGVNLTYYGNQGQLEYDFNVAPGADPNAIKLAFTGADRVSIDAEGDLALTIDGQQILHRRPVLYQDVGGVRLPVSGRYGFDDQQHVRFQIGVYDAAQPLVIDPVLAYSTFLGGSFSDGGEGIAVDSLGFAYVTGQTDSLNFPTANPWQATRGGGTDAFVAKLSPAGDTLVYSTYLGGTLADVGRAIAVDSAQFAYVTGSTKSPNFPLANALQRDFLGSQDAFVAKLSPEGDVLVFSTYLGGHGAEQLGSGIAVDSIDPNFVYVTGTTDAPDFPTANALQRTFGGDHDAFVAKLSPDGRQLAYSTYLGGSGLDVGSSITADATGFAYVIGQTASVNFPVANALQPANAGGSDTFVAKLNPEGDTLVFSTYLGGTSFEEGTGIAVDPLAPDFVYLTGSTTSVDFPTANALFPVLQGLQDVFVAKLSGAGDTLAYSTYLGGSEFDGGKDIDVDSTGFAYVTGFTMSPDFPTVDPLQSRLLGASNAYVAKLNPDGSALVYSTYLGGSTFDGATGIAVNPVAPGFAFVTGFAASTDFPTARPLQPRHGGGSSDAFVTAIAP